MLDTFDYCLLNAHKINLPVFMQLADIDLIVSRPAAEKFYERIKSTRKDLKVYKGTYHEIFNELERKAVYTDLDQFLKGIIDA